MHWFYKSIHVKFHVKINLLGSVFRLDMSSRLRECLAYFIKRTLSLEVKLDRARVGFSKRVESSNYNLCYRLDYHFSYVSFCFRVLHWTMQLGQLVLTKSGT